MMRNHFPVRRTQGSCTGQRGASALEFALIFPLMFGVSYGAVVYSYAYMLRQSMTFAAQEAAEAAVAVDPVDSAYETLVQSRATAAVDSVIRWMPSALRANIEKEVRFCTGGGATPCPPDGDAVVVTLTLPMTGASPLFARFTLPLIGNFPPLPDNMTAQAVARV